jgi:RNA recognition motif-containing protein
MTNVPTSRDGAKCQPPESHDDAPRNVYVASLPAAFTDRQLYELAAPYGPIASHRMFNTTKHVAQTGHSYGFVLYANPTAAAAAVEGLADRPLGDRRLQVRLSRNGVVKKRRAAPGGLEGTPGERKLVSITTSPPPGTGTALPASNGHVDSSLSSNPLDPLPVQNDPPSPSSGQQAGNNSLQPSTEAAQEPPQFHADARTAPQAQLAGPWPTAGHYFPNGPPSMPAWLPAHPSFVPMTYPTYPYPAPPFANAGRLQYVAFGHPGAALVSPLGTIPMPPPGAMAYSSHPYSLPVSMPQPMLPHGGAMYPAPHAWWPWGPPSPWP